MLSDNNKMAADKADYTSSRTGAQRSVEPASPELAEEALVQVGLLGSRAVSALSYCWFSWKGRRPHYQGLVVPANGPVKYFY